MPKIGEMFKGLSKMQPEVDRMAVHRVEQRHDDEEEDFGLGAELDETLQKSFEPIAIIQAPQIDPPQGEVLPTGAPLNRNTFEGSKSLKTKQLNDELESFINVAVTIKHEIAYRENELAEVEAIIKALTTSIECLNGGSAQKADNPPKSKVSKESKESKEFKKEQEKSHAENV